MSSRWSAQHEELPDGSLRGPDAVVYRRTPRRVTRRLGAEMIAAGAAVVTNVYPEGMTFYGQDTAEAAWSRIAQDVVVGRRPPVRDLQWVGHVWVSDDGHLLLRFDGEH
ncbi:hypothetical protein [Isoptericola croceus]|uniref:hypothetical protein n=1 Tax=Isoptericola croceus TaxID=3031406 RepID=UPI0023FA391C|nr:hypothetical protein [Isoptericola croceus]